MSIFDNIARAFGPKAPKPPTVPALERLLRESSEDLEAARVALEALEAGRVHAVLEGEAARIALRAKIAEGRDHLAELEIAHAAVSERLEQARVEAAEKGRREQYERVKAQQIAVADSLAAKYQSAVDELLRLKAMVADVDEQAATVNQQLPSGAAPLPREVEGTVRDIPGRPREVLKSETVELWCGVSGDPIHDQSRVRKTGASTGVIDVTSSLGNRAVQVHLRPFRRQTVRPWVGPVYAERLADLVLPALKPEAPPAAKEIEELEPVAPAAVAAE